MTQYIYYQSDKGILFNGDSLEVLKSLEDESVDLIITSPPYNLHKHHKNGKKTGCYQDDIPEPRYQKNQIKVLNECFRVLKPGGSMIYNHKNRIYKGVLITPYEWLLKTKFILKQEIVWDNGGLNGHNIRFYPSSERIFWMVKDPTVTLLNVHNLRDVVTRKHWRPVALKGKHTKVFPIQFPLDIIDCFPNAKVILDPYMGSGTVAMAAQKSNKHWIGIEKLKKFCKLTFKNCTTLGLTSIYTTLFYYYVVELIKKLSQRKSNQNKIY